MSTCRPLALNRLLYVKSYQVSPLPAGYEPCSLGGSEHDSTCKNVFKNLSDTFLAQELIQAPKNRNFSENQKDRFIQAVTIDIRAISKT